MPRKPSRDPDRSGDARDVLIVMAIAAGVLVVGALGGVWAAVTEWLRADMSPAASIIAAALLTAVVALGALGALKWRRTASERTRRRTAEDRIRDVEGRYRALVEQLPVVTYVDEVDDLSTALYISPQYETLTGYTPEQRLGDPAFWANTLLHPEDRERVLEESIRTNRSGDPFDIEYRIVTADGSTKWVHDHAVLVDRPNGDREWQGVLTDITERKLAFDALARRDRILEAVGHAAERLLRTRTWTECIIEVLDRLGTATEATRARVFENLQNAAGETATVCRHVWSSPEGELDDLEGPSEVGTTYLAAGLKRWTEVLGRGEVIQGPADAFPRPERAILESWGTGSCILVPVHVEGEWWGFIEFADAREGRTWQAAEVDALRVAANTLGAKIGRERARARLSEAQLRYGSLVETLPAVIYVDTCEEQGQPLYVSPQVEAILGYTVESWMSDPFLWEDNLHPKDRGRAVGNVRQHHATGDPLDHEYRLRGADGRWIWIRDQSVALHDDQGEPTYVQGVMFDVTQQKEAENQLREAEERFRAIVEHVPAAIYLDRADTSFETQYINPQIEALTGITPLEWISSPDAWLDALHPDDRDDLVTEYAAAIKAGRPWVGEYRMRTRDGRTIWVHDETTFVSSASGEQLLQGVIFDITEQKLAEQALRSSEQREREAAERLRALDEMKNTFLAAVSHELRSPLTSILGLALTLERVPELGDADRRDLLSRLSQNARKLDRLLRDLLDVDRLNRGIVAPQYHTIDVGALARRTLESLDALGDRDVTVEAQPVVISADAAKIERIVENLLMNADRHTEPDRHIWLRVLPWDNGVLIAVDDDGPGVPEESRRAIFEPFQRGGEAAGDAPGTGLGLSLVARFAELHGGRAWVEDRVEGGSSFRVFIPAPVEPAAAATPASRGAAGPQPTVAAEGR